VIRTSIVIAALLIAGLQHQVVGQTIEIPLPELAGEFNGSGDLHLSTIVRLANPPGRDECTRFPDQPWPEDLIVETWDAVGRAWWFAGAGVPDLGEIGVQELFDVTVEFQPMTGATWNGCSGWQ